MATQNASGQTRVTVVDGTTFTGFYAPDGSINVFDATLVTSHVGMHHPCGATNVFVVDGTTPVGKHAANGALNVVPNPITFGPRHPSGAISVDGSFGGAAALLRTETNGFAVDFTDNTLSVKDTTTAENYWDSLDGTATTFWKNRSFTSYTGATSGKRVRDASGYYKPQLQNMMAASELILSARYTKGNVTVADGGVPPSGLTYAALLTETITNAGHAVYNASAITTVINTAYTVSSYVKAGTKNFVAISLFGTANVFVTAVFDLSDGLTTATQTGVGATSGTYISASKTNIGGGWYRITLTGSMDSTNAFVVVGSAEAATGNTFSTAIGTPSFTGVVTNTIYVTGVQLNPGMEALEYVPTTAHNLILQSQTFANASWIEFGGFVSAITEGTVVAPDGSSTADVVTCVAGNTLKLVYQDVTFLATPVYTFSMYVKKDTHSFVYLNIAGGSSNVFVTAVFNLDGTTGAATQFADGSVNGTYISSAQEDVGNNWRRISVTFTIDAAGSFSPLLGVCGAASGNTLDLFGRNVFNAVGTESCNVWGAQLELASSPGKYVPTTTAAVYSSHYDLPREWDASGVCQGILVEEARTNVCLYSTQFDNAAWAKTDSTISANNTTSPAGVLDADLVTEGTAGTASTRTSASVAITAGATVTISVFVRKSASLTWFRMLTFETSASTSSFSCNFNLDTGIASTPATGGSASGVSATMTSVGNGWYRCTITGVYDGSSTAVQLQLNSASASTGATRVNSASYWLWQAQIETGSFPTSPIVTGSASVTRARDKITNATTVMPFSTATGTWYAKGVYLGSTAVTYTPIVTVLAGDTTNDRLPDMSLLSGPGGVAGWGRSDIRVGGVQTYDGGIAGTAAVNTSYKVATAYAVNNANTAANGTLGTQDTSVTVGAVVDTVQIGGRALNANLNGYVQQIMFVPTRKTDAELQTLTT